MLFQVAHRRFRRAAHFAVELFQKYSRGRARRNFRSGLRNCRAEIFHAMRRGCRVQRIAPCEQSEQDARVRDASREGAT